jgi:single-strand DNA-binding protein
MLNRVILIGRLTADPELRYTPSGTPVANFRLAVDRMRSQSGERQTDFISIVLWSKQAEFAANYLNKGRLVAIEGRLQIRQWTTQDGQRRSSAEVVGDRVQALDRRREEAGAPAGEAATPSDLPDPGEVDNAGVDTPGPWDDQ